MMERAMLEQPPVRQPNPRGDAVRYQNKLWTVKWEGRTRGGTGDYMLRLRSAAGYETWAKPEAVERLSDAEVAFGPGAPGGGFAPGSVPSERVEPPAHTAAHTAAAIDAARRELDVALQRASAAETRASAAEDRIAVLEGALKDRIAALEAALKEIIRVVPVLDDLGPEDAEIVAKIGARLRRTAEAALVHSGSAISAQDRESQ